MKFCALVVVVTMVAQQTLSGQGMREPVASRTVLEAALASAADHRAANLRKVRELLGDPDARRVIGGDRDVRRVAERLAALDDRTLERLARETDAATQQSSGGGVGKVLLVVLLTIVVLAIVASAFAPESS